MIKFKGLARYDKGIVGNESEITDEGYIKTRAIVTRTGVFFYKNADGTVRNELRHPDDVLIPESLESIKMIPIVNGHPAERLVSADNAKRLSVGYTGELVENENPYIVANLMITDKATVDQIKKKKKNELSLGYTVDLIEESGMYFGEPYNFRQTNIKYNHLALVDQARAGPEARISLDGDDAEQFLKEEEAVMANKKTRQVTIDAEQYMLEDDAAGKMEELMRKHDDLMKAHEGLKMEHEKMKAERDSLRDKDHHNPAATHEFEGEPGSETEEDEIGPGGKEEMDPTTTYGEQSHVKDYEKPSSMKEHVVQEPKNKHYPHDLPHISKVDAADINRRVNDRVKLVRVCEKYLDKASIARMDSMSDMELKTRVIMTLQPKAQLHGQTQTYINARYDAAIESLPQAKVIAEPVKQYKSDADEEKDTCNSVDARRSMIKRHQNAYKAGRK